MLIRCYLTFLSCPCLLATLQPPACSVLFHINMAEAINCNAIFLSVNYLLWMSISFICCLADRDSHHGFCITIRQLGQLGKQWPSDHLGFQTRSPRSSADLACTSPRNLAATCAGMMRRDCAGHGTRAWPAALRLDFLRPTGAKPTRTVACIAELSCAKTC